MSQHGREINTGNLKNSMRVNYSEYGVEEYYKKVGTTYRNPHFSGVRNSLFLWFNHWWKAERLRVEPEGFTMFDMACGLGEGTVSLVEWWKSGKVAYVQQTKVAGSATNGHSRGKKNPFMPPSLSPTAVQPQIMAADPYTSEAFHARTGLHNCSTLSFKDITEGLLPPIYLSTLHTAENPSNTGLVNNHSIVEMTICSFALHLIESPSELFALLWELSTKCRWLVILAPHKKPEIKSGWGWTKWNVDTWNECPMSETSGEILQERVHCRVYRSLNVQ